MLDLYVCLRPVRYFKGVPSPVKHPEKVDMVIFRENTEDIYAGIEWEAGTEEAKKVLALPREGVPEGVQEDPLPGHDAASASSRSRARAPSASCAPRSSTRSQHEAQERHPRAQGQHHEVHRGRVPRTGATRSPSASSATRSTPGSSGSGPRRRRARRPPTPSRRRSSRRARSSSRTRSPTSRCSRCSRGPRSSTSSPR